MQPFLIFLSILVLLSPQVHARIGEDYSKCRDRYGDLYIKYDGDHGSEYALFEVSVFKINITLWNGCVHRIAYGKESAFSEAEIAYMLKVNGDGRKWLRNARSCWRTRDGKLSAVRRSNGSVVIYTSEYEEHHSRLQKP